MTDLRTAAQAVDDAYFDDAAPDIQMKIAMSALRTTLAQQDVCEWTQDGGTLESSCGETFCTDNDYAPPSEYMKFCLYCGKPIKFLESEHE